MLRILLIQPLLLLAFHAPSQSWEVIDMTTAGFPSNGTTGLAEDGQGNIWVTTDWGLCRYDGTNWTVYQSWNSGLPDNILHAIAVDTLDRLWLGTQSHGVVMYDGSTWTEYNMLNSPIPNDDIICVTVDHRSWVWVGTSSGMACFTGSEWRIYDDTPASYNGLVLNGPNIQDIAVRPDGLVAIGTLNYGFHYLTDTSVTVHATYIDLFPDNTQLGVAFDFVNDERWLATPSQGLLRQGGSWVNGPWFQYATWTSAIPTNSLTCITIDHLGRPWAGSVLSGVVRRNTNGSFVLFDEANSDLPNNSIEDLLTANDGSIWVATAFAGAARLDLATSLADVPDRTPAVFPNPCSGRLWVDLGSRPGPFTWELTDMLGRSNATGTGVGGTTVQLDLTGSAPGIFLLHILQGSSTMVTKVRLTP